jgi:hypothetical protein
MKLLASTALGAALLICPAFAQAPAQNPGQAPAGQAPAKPAGTAGEATITGCLNRDANKYVLSEEAGGAKTEITGMAAQLDPHAANQKVTITGKKTMKDGKSTIEATKVEFVAATCSVKS